MRQEIVGRTPYTERCSRPVAGRGKSSWPVYICMLIAAILSISSLPNRVDAQISTVAEIVSIADSVSDLAKNLPEAASNAYCKTIQIRDVHERRIQAVKLQGDIGQISVLVGEVEAQGAFIVSDIGDYLANRQPAKWAAIVRESQDQLGSLRRLAGLLSGEETQLRVAVPDLLLAIKVKGHLVEGIEQLKMPKSRYELDELKGLQEKLSREIDALGSANEKLQAYVKAGGESLPECITN